MKYRILLFDVDNTLLDFDANEEEIQAVEAGDLKGMIVQKPFEMGYRVVRTALDVLEGKPVERFVDTGGDKRESE